MFTSAARLPCPQQIRRHHLLGNEAVVSVIKHAQKADASDLILLLEKGLQKIAKCVKRHILYSLPGQFTDCKVVAISLNCHHCSLTLISKLINCNNLTAKN